MRQVRVQLLINNTAVADSGWKDLGAQVPGGSIITRGAGASDAVEIHVSNDPQIPVDDGIILGAALTADAITKLDVCYRWVKAKRTTAAGSPAVVNVQLFGVSLE